MVHKRTLEATGELHLSPILKETQLISSKEVEEDEDGILTNINHNNNNSSSREAVVEDTTRAVDMASNLVGEGLRSTRNPRLLNTMAAEAPSNPDIRAMEVPTILDTKARALEGRSQGVRCQPCNNSTAGTEVGLAGEKDMKPAHIPLVH